jgi:hypothetical protein
MTALFEELFTSPVGQMTTGGFQPHECPHPHAPAGVSVQVLSAQGSTAVASYHHYTTETCSTSDVEDDDGPILGELRLP